MLIITMHLDQYLLHNGCFVNFFFFKYNGQLRCHPLWLEKSEVLLNSAELVALLLAINDPSHGLPSTLPGVA